MTLFFLECTIRAALIVIGTAIVLYAMRVKVASIKHRVWTAVLFLMLALPFWTAWGPKAPVRLLPASVERFASQPLAPVAPPTPNSAQQIAPSTQPPTDRHLFPAGEEILLGIYLFGCLTLLFRLAIGTRKAQRLIRAASNVSSRIPGAVSRGEGSAVAFAARNKQIDIRSSDSCAAPVTVGCLRPMVILPAHWRKWSPRQLEAVLAHEGEHVRRRDPLIQWLALFNRAIFWFHPAAWWLERELCALAEESCDAAVIAQGHDPRDYAETLMKIARDVMDSGSRINSVAVAMPGPRLPDRIRTIIESPPIPRVSRVRATCLVLACAITLPGSATGVLAHAHSPGAQHSIEAAARLGDAPVPGRKAIRSESSARSPAAASFEVASVKPNTSGAQNDHFSLSPGRYTVTNTTTRNVIKFAYGMRDFQITGIPTWADTDRFDIDATAGQELIEQWRNLPREQQIEELRPMVQSLLAARFGMTATHVVRELPVYALVVANSGPKLTASGTSMAQPQFHVSGGPDGQAVVTAKNEPVSALVTMLSQQLDHAGADQSGLKGTYDFDLHWSPNQSSAPSPAIQEAVSGDAPSIFTALQEQLGLRLQSTKGPVDTIVIDHIEKPTPN
ncbi:MAG TPA: M56 family metallopeptidase [Candidatus Binataceae bacterium]|nr:M56 family metallopeptidase [Candidatus Binataceae bacterium]